MAEAAVKSCQKKSLTLGPICCKDQMRMHDALSFEGATKKVQVYMIVIIMYLWMLVIILAIQDCSYTVKGENICVGKPPCVCCKSGYCTGESTTSCEGCIPGYTGKDCTESCPENCVNCSQTFHDSDRTCYKCKDGNYNGRYHDVERYPELKDCSLSCRTGCASCTAYEKCNECEHGYYMSENKCIKCPSNCVSCSSELLCTKCQIGFYGEYCSLHLIGNTDDHDDLYSKTVKGENICFDKPPCVCCESGYCTGENTTSCEGCILGYTGKDCTESCPEKCINCSQTFHDSDRTCYNCKDGNYNGRYHDVVIYPELKDCSLSCRTGCASCTSYDKCNECEQGYYMSENKCIKCPSNCVSCLSELLCTKCQIGFYGEYCSYPSPFNCLDDEPNCSITNGTRLIGNTDDNVNYDVDLRAGIIDGCETGYYNENESCKPCPTNCTECISRLSCTVCKVGNHGSSCSFFCSDTCHDKECNIATGHCLSCKAGYFMDKRGSCVKCPQNCTACKSARCCFACKDGYMGDYCQDNCFDCEKDSGCDKNTGYCIASCRRGLSGELCNIKCDLKCSSCNRLDRSKCESCAQERYGLNCDVDCPLNCLNNSCTNIDGVCNGGCVTGYWGEMCNNTCSKDCKDNVCNITDEECSKGNQTSATDTTALAHLLVIMLLNILILVTCLVLLLLRCNCTSYSSQVCVLFLQHWTYSYQGNCESKKKRFSALHL